jgi:aspartyl-tRNA(Asn)/glutamyl-tRNA(Gln) amidotransferase subunit A
MPLGHDHSTAASGVSTEADPALWSVGELLAAFRKRELSPVEATRAALARIARYDRTVNAFCLVDENRALESARESERRWRRCEPLGPVDGVPATVKELLLAKHWPTTRCSRAIDSQPPWDEDAPSVARLRAAGAVLLGKTTSPEFGCKGTTDSARFGITRNPWDLARTSGGSSGGAAVAAALGMGTLHLGTDGGGSIRMPAAFSGVFGFKPTYGRVAVYPPSVFGTTSHVGSLTRTVDDAIAMLKVLAGPDLRDWLALPDDRCWLDGTDGSLHGLRIAYSPTLGYASVDPEIAKTVATAVEAFAARGASLTVVERPFDDPTEMFRRFWYSGTALAVAAIPDEKRALLDPELRRMAEAGERVAHVEYLQAGLERARLGIAMNRFHEQFDLLITPAMPIAAFGAGLQVQDASRQRDWIDWTPFTYPFNLTHQPAAAMPCGFTSAGLPIAMQIVGKVYADALVLRAARAYEAVRPIALPGQPHGAVNGV